MSCIVIEDGAEFVEPEGSVSAQVEHTASDLEEVGLDSEVSLEELEFCYRPKSAKFGNLNFRFREPPSEEPEIEFSIHDDWGRKAAIVSFNLKDSLNDDPDEAFGSIMEQAYHLDLFAEERVEISDRDLAGFIERARSHGVDIEFESQYRNPYLEERYTRTMITLRNYATQHDLDYDSRLDRPLAVKEAVLRRDGDSVIFDISSNADVLPKVESEFRWLNIVGEPTPEILKQLEEVYGIKASTLERSRKYRSTQDVEEKPYGLFISNPVFEVDFTKLAPVQVGRFQSFIGEKDGRRFIVTIQSGCRPDLELDLKKTLANIDPGDPIPLNVQIFDHASTFLNQENHIAFEELSNALDTISEHSTVEESSKNVDARNALKRLIRPIQDIQDYVASHSMVGFQLARHLRGIEGGRAFADLIGANHTELVNGADRLSERLKMTRSRRDENESRRWQIGRDAYNNARKPLLFASGVAGLYAIDAVVRSSDSPKSTLLRLGLHGAVALGFTLFSMIRKPRPERDLLSDSMHEKRRSPWSRFSR